MLRIAARFIYDVLLPNPAHDSTESGESHSLAKIRTALQTSFHLANEHINAVPFNLVDRKWLRLYTDTSILQSALDLATGPTDGEDERASWLEAVRRLDTAIIVAGAAGERRAEWIQNLIGDVQRIGLPRYDRHRMDESPPPPRTKKQRIAKNLELVESEDLYFAPSPIPTLAIPPSVSGYLRDHREQPFILRQHLRSPDSPSPPWPAIDRWRSPDYLLDLVGEGRVVPVEVGSAYDDVDWGQRIIPLRDFLARAGYDVTPQSDKVPETASSPLYLAQHPLLSQFPALERDISIPDYVWSNPAPTAAVPMYHPPDTKDGLMINVWVGSGGGEIVSPAHTVSYVVKR